tara:strand:- start:120 stop:707 length:588 start_codon:yes stop_codon:yes gene_type:complete
MRFITLIFLLGIATLTNAQNFQSGLIAGISTSQVSGDVLGGFNKIGLQLGGVVNHPVGKNSNGQFGLYYIDKGSNDPKSLFQIDLSYVESSYSFLYNYQGFNWEGGLLIGVLIDGKTYDKYGNEYAIESQFNRFDIGAKLAVGKELLPKLQMFWEISNTIPLFPIQEHPAYVSILNKGKMNAVLSFSFRYLLGDK